MEKADAGHYYVTTGGNIAKVDYATVDAGIVFHAEWGQPRTEEDMKEFEDFSYRLMGEIARGILDQISGELRKGEEALGTGSIRTGIKGVC